MSTQVQAEVSSVLDELKFENRGADMPGAPQKFGVTAETVKFVQSLFDESKLVMVDGTGSLSFD